MIDTKLRTALLETLACMAVGGLGAGLFVTIGFPAPFLAGPAIAVTLASLLGARLSILPPVRDTCFLLLGIGIGSSVTPDVLEAAAKWPASLAIMSVTLIVTLIACRTLLRRAFGFEKLPATLAATPGHLSYVIGIATDLRSDTARIAIVQSMRVLFLTVAVPAILAVWGVEGDAPQPNTGPMSVFGFVVIVLVSAALAMGLSRLSIPAAWLLGGMIASGVGHGSELAPGQLPAWMTLTAFTIMGSLIGLRFRGRSSSDLRRNLGAGVALTALSCALAVAGALVSASLLDLPFALMLMSFAPGGVEVMAAMAVQIGIEPTVVAAHHVFRLLVLTVVIGVVLGQEKRARQSGQ
ncbi:Putative ammonia monooxygenase [Roseivivax jejudonensis]|uniref:Putative ammonia monooxygenase n=1 Tax=Roseivivax jejudonensis TaxID=1529041 RepID=A0A1X6Y781_9RHOB|nr:AbrB family transcriptional regulator [Roseivivax jejudonensis]SLN12746.1 Putative ammonia monooxygenase [Roseivivax jejudonensis]